MANRIELQDPSVNEKAPDREMVSHTRTIANTGKKVTGLRYSYKGVTYEIRAAKRYEAARRRRVSPHQNSKAVRLGPVFNEHGKRLRGDKQDGVRFVRIISDDSGTSVPSVSAAEVKPRRKPKVKG